MIILQSLVERVAVSGEFIPPIPMRHFACLSHFFSLTPSQAPEPQGIRETLMLQFTDP
jgi:hypothetical protein